MRFLTVSALSVNIPRCSSNSVGSKFCELRLLGFLRTSPLRSSKKFLRCDYTFRATADTSLVPSATTWAHSWLTVVATLAKLERSLCAPSGMDLVHAEGGPT